MPRSELKNKRLGGKTGVTDKLGGLAAKLLAVPIMWKSKKIAVILKIKAERKKKRR